MRIASLFHKRENVRLLLENAQEAALKLYGLAEPTDAQKLRASVYLCITSIALINDYGGRRFDSLIDEVAKESASLVKSLNMIIGELADDADDLRAIVATFPGDLEITAGTRINGLGAFDALYNARVEKLMNEILSHSKGPFGTPGFASIAGFPLIGPTQFPRLGTT